MSTITSKQRKRHGLVDPVFVLAFLVMILALLVFVPLTDDIHDSFRLGSPSNAAVSSPLNSRPSFASDLKYWNANCSHGWQADSVCEGIVAKTQSCSVSVDSVYCSAYKNYLQEYLKK